MGAIELHRNRLNVQRVIRWYACCCTRRAGLSEKRQACRARLEQGHTAEPKEIAPVHES
jgi:hypothetical protein